MKKLFTYLAVAVSLSSLLPTAGKAAAGNDNPTGPAGQFSGSITTAGSYDPYTGNASRAVEDLSVAGSIGAYPLKWTRVLNTRRPTGWDRLGRGGWNHSYDWRVSIRTTTGGHPEHWNDANYDEVYEGPDATVHYPDGRVVEFGGDPAVGFSGMADAETFVLLTPNEGGYDLVFLDGGKVLFRTESYVINGVVKTGLHAKAIVDPYGQATNFGRDSAGRLITVTEPGGRYLQINYAPHWAQYGYVYVITSVQAFHSQGQLSETVSYEYTDPFNSGNHPYLTRVNYADGNHATYTYQATNTYQPPNTVSQSAGPLISTCHDVRFSGTMSRIKYEFLTYAQNGNQPVGWGQLRAERSLTTGQVVSQITYPLLGQPAQYYRTETRGDGVTRSFYYQEGDGAVLQSYTDFKNQSSSISAFVDNGIPLVRRVFTDARGNATTTHRSFAFGAVKMVTHPGGSTVEYTHTDLGRPHYLASRKDERNHITVYTRDPERHWITRTDYPDGGNEQFTYNSFGQIETHTMASGGMENFRYYPSWHPNRGQKSEYWPPATSSDLNPSDHKTLYFYYESGPHTDRLQRVQDPRGNSTSYEYNLRGQVTKVIHQDGSYTQSAYNPDGTLAWSADENHPNASWDVNQRTRYTYDEYKRVLSVTNPMNETTTNNYAQDWVNPLIHTTRSIKRTTLPSGRAVDYAYDENWRKILQVTAPGTSEQAWTWFGYDAVGNLTSTTDPRSKISGFGYDSRNRQTTVTDASGHVTRTDYDPAGNINWVRRAEGVAGIESTVQYPEYDPMNRLKRQIDERGVETHMIYDSAGNLRVSYDGNGQPYEYQYDYLNRVTAFIFPGGSFETKAYDFAGNLTIQRNRVGNHRYASYDNRNRQTWFEWDDGVTQPQLTAYDAASRITSLQNWEADITPTYDEANRKTSETTTIKSYGLWATRSTAYQYDPDGNRSRLIYPQGYQFVYGYTNRNQLDNIKLDPAIFGGYYHTPLVRYNYDLSGNRDRRTLISGAHAEYDIDEVNRIRAQANYFANGQMGRFDYDFDAKGRRRYEQRDWGTADGFQHDPSDQVTSYKRDGTLNGDGTVTVPFWNANVLTYDHNGNRIEMTGPGGARYSKNNLNQYENVSSLGSMGYDGKGNLTSGDGWTYIYDAQNRLTTMQGPGTTITMTYDPLNRVITRNVNGAVTQNVWEGWNLIEEHRPDWSIQRCYLQGANQNEMVAAFDGNVYSNHWYWQDGRGNTSHITGDPGNLLERYTYDLSGAPKFYDEWGSERWGGSVYDTRFLFGGSQYLPDTGLYDMRNRFYHIALNRFLQTDPLGFKGDPLNLYRYCGNDPVDRSDPMGLFDYQGDPAEWARVKQYLSRDPVMKSIIDRGESLRIPIKPNNQFRTNVPKLGPTRINWDSHSGIKTTDGGYQSPALQLGHELDHALRRATDLKNYKVDDRTRDRSYDTREERRVIQGSESHAAKTLGEAVRTNHRGEITRTNDPLEKYGKVVPRGSVQAGTGNTDGTSETRMTAGMLDALLQAQALLSFGIGGGEAGEGFHPPGAR